MSVEAVDLHCPQCGSALQGGQQLEVYHCAFCDADTPHADLVAPERTLLGSNIDRLWHCVTGDFDHDGWLEVCGWFEHTIYAVDPVDRTILWTALPESKNEDQLYSGPGRVYVATEEGELHALNALTGQRVWSVTLSDEVRGVHDPGRSAVFVRTDDDRLSILDRANGSIKTRMDRSMASGDFIQAVDGRVVERLNTGIRIWDPVHDEPLVAKLGDDLGAALDDPGKLKTARSISVMKAGAHHGVFYAVLDLMQAGQYRLEVDAYRLSDGERVAEYVAHGSGHSGELHESSYREPAITGGQLVFLKEPDEPGTPGKIHLVPTGISRTFPEDPDYEAMDVYCAGETIIVEMKKTRGKERYAFAGLDPSTLETLWQLDNVGLLYGPPSSNEELFVYQLTEHPNVRLVAIDPASGSTLWDAVIRDNSQERLYLSHGLVVDYRDGNTFLAESGEQLFPVAKRASGLDDLPPEGPGTADGSEELPSWPVSPGKPEAVVSGQTRQNRVFVLVVAAVMMMFIIGLAVFLVLLAG